MKKITNQSITKTDKMLEENTADQLQKLLKLKKIIEIVNFVPPDIVMPHVWDLFGGDLYQIFADGEERLQADRAHKLLDGVETTIFEDYPELKNYVFSASSPRDTYNYFWHWHFFLPKLALDSTNYAHRRREFGEKDFYFEHSASYFRNENPTSLKARNNTLLPTAPSVDFLFGLKNIDRLRVCEICKRVFWANRKDAWGCSPQHSNLIRVRRARKNAEQRQEKWINSGNRKDFLNQNFSEKDGEK